MKICTYVYLTYNQYDTISVVFNSDQADKILCDSFFVNLRLSCAMATDQSNIATARAITPLI